MFCREAQNKRGMISEAERAAQEAAEARRRDEQRQRELRGAVESQQRTVDSAVTDTQQRVGGESPARVTVSQLNMRGQEPDATQTLYKSSCLHGVRFFTQTSLQQT